MKQIIIFSGKAEAGKDYIATKTKEILESCDSKVLITHYADYLKYLCKEYFNWDGNKDDVGREILQRIGTDVVRNKIPEFWARNVCQFIEVFWDEYDYILISDCRFPDEIELLIDIFGKEFISSVRIERINKNGFPFENSLTYKQNSHASETALDSRQDLFDLVIRNYAFEYDGFNLINEDFKIINHLKMKEKL